MHNQHKTEDDAGFETIQYHWHINQCLENLSSKVEEKAEGTYKWMCISFHQIISDAQNQLGFTFKKQS